METTTTDPVMNFIVGAVSFVLLVVASWCVGEGGEILGKKYDASIIGGLVIAWLNTAPETIFFISALEGGHPKFAMGAVSGSSIVVCTVALGACLWIGANARRSGFIFLQTAIKRQCYILGSSVLVPIGVIIWGFNMASGLFGVAFYLAFLAYSLNKGDVSVHDLEKADEVEDEEEEEEESVTKGILYLCVGGIMIFIFSSPFIKAVVVGAYSMNVSPTLLAFFLAPIASEAPEILESISLSRKGNSQNINIAFSNLVGGTITKTTLLCGILCFYGISKEYAWESPNYTISLCLIITCAAAAAAIGGLFSRQSAYHGMTLFALFVVTGCIQYFLNGNVSPDEIAVE